jgi:hypothetical protein
MGSMAVNDGLSSSIALEPPDPVEPLAFQG